MLDINKIQKLAFFSKKAWFVFSTNIHSQCNAVSRLLVLVLGLVVVASLYVDRLTSPDTSRTSHGLVRLRLLLVHQREVCKPVKDGDTCSSDDTQCWQCKHGVDE
jgi:hypothetical protein